MELAQRLDADSSHEGEAIARPLRDAMAARGFTELTSVQQAVLDPAALGRNLRISSQTGSGKTVALGLVLGPDLLDARACEGTVALVVTPTRELAMQVQGELRWLFAQLGHVRVEVVTGGSDIVRERHALRRGPTILVATPGRLLDHVRRGAVRCDTVRHLVLDEADRMLDMGFREDLEAIVAALPSERRSHLVSATFPPQVRRLADAVQGDALVIQGTALGVANDDIEHVVSVVERGDTYAAVVNALLLARGQKVLVFVERRVDAGELADRLVGDGFAVQSLSGDLSQAQRNRALEAFRSGVVDVLVSTDVAARGLDVPDISLVIQLDLPKDPDDYTHRSGRTGRAGRKGRSLLLVGPREQARARAVLRAAKVDAAWRPLPTPEEIHESIAEHTRARVLERLDVASTPRAIAQATALLDGRAPALVVASLLSLAASDLPCEPKHVRNPAADRPRPGDRARPAVRAKHIRHTGNYVRFSINWGHRKGATPSRLLSHLCRRGAIDSGMVGSIEIGPGSATFEVADHIAGTFEQRVREPDQRDPQLRIARDD
ncbi:MAG: DEAD/DEAH box helicase [Nannocystaceae bacterium]|nr:DEAD/DEAH box helicase [Nannocystaceae bacterium]